jgi:hypothetical protein
MKTKSELVLVAEVSSKYTKTWEVSKNLIEPFENWIMMNRKRSFTDFVRLVEKYWTGYFDFSIKLLEEKNHEVEGKSILRGKQFDFCVFEKRF